MVGYVLHNIILLHGSTVYLLCFTRVNKKRKCTTSDMIDLEILRIIKEGKSQETADENVLFGQYVGSSLQNMSPRKRPYVKMRIQQLLYEAECLLPLQPSSRPSPLQAGISPFHQEGGTVSSYIPSQVGTSASYLPNIYQRNE